MLYIAQCKLCDFLTHSTDVATFKDKVATHLDKHGFDITFPSEMRLKSDEVVTILRIRSLNITKILLDLFKTPKFWHSYRNRNKLALQLATLFSGKRSGEIKPFCNPN